MDFQSNAKTNDGNINDFLYSGDSPGANGYDLPADPGSSKAYMQQPMNKGQTVNNGLNNVNNANDKIAMLAKLKQ